MQRLLPLLFCVFLMSESVFAQQTLDSMRIQLPTAWIGTWAGKLDIIASNGSKNSVAMQLIIAPTDSVNRWNWHIIYGEGDKKQDRKYQLISINPAKGWYKIDEKNGIFLDAFYANNTLANAFEVENNQLLTLLRGAGKALEFEIYMSVTKEPNLTGGTLGIPTVKSFPIRVAQKAILKKVKTITPKK